MNTQSQREALNLLAEIWALSPDVRFGQLMAHLGFLGEAHLDRGLGYIDDDDLIRIMSLHKNELLERVPDKDGLAVAVGESHTPS